MRTRAKSSISCYVFISSRGMETLCWLLFLVCELPSADCHALHSDALLRSFLVFSVCPPFFMVYRFDCCFFMFTLQPFKGLAQTKLMIFLLFLMVLVIFLMWRMYFSFLLLLWIMKNEQRTVYEMLCVARYMDYLIAVVVAATVSAFECCGLCCGDDVLACRLLCLCLDIGEVYLEMCRL